MSVQQGMPGKGKSTAPLIATALTFLVSLMQAALNIDISVSRIGFYGSRSEKLWCLSHTETLHLWEWEAACDEEAAGRSNQPGWHI